MLDQLQVVSVVTYAPRFFVHEDFFAVVQGDFTFVLEGFGVFSLKDAGCGCPNQLPSCVL